MLQSRFKFFYYFSCAWLVLTVVSCDDDSQNQDLGEFTGSEITYQLFASSDYNNEGYITFKERKDESIQAEVVLSNTQDGGVHPLHLHREPITADGALVAILNPVEGESGQSRTIFSVLGDETKFTFADLLNFDGSIRVHLDDGIYKDEILAGGNVGINRLNDLNVVSCTDFTNGL